MLTTSQMLLIAALVLVVTCLALAGRSAFTERLFTRTTSVTNGHAKVITDNLEVSGSAQVRDGFVLSGVRQLGGSAAGSVGATTPLMLTEDLRVVPGVVQIIYYVHTLGGSDSSDGKTPTTPFQTVPRALRALSENKGWLSGALVRIMGDVYRVNPGEVWYLHTHVHEERTVFIQAEGDLWVQSPTPVQYTGAGPTPLSPTDSCQLVPYSGGFPLAQAQAFQLLANDSSGNRITAVTATHAPNTLASAAEVPDGASVLAVSPRLVISLEDADLTINTNSGTLLVLQNLSFRSRGAAGAGGRMLRVGETERSLMRSPGQVRFERCEVVFHDDPDAADSLQLELAAPYKLDSCTLWAAHADPGVLARTHLNSISPGSWNGCAAHGVQVTFEVGRTTLESCALVGCTLSTRGSTSFLNLVSIYFEGALTRRGILADLSSTLDLVRVFLQMQDDVEMLIVSNAAMAKISWQALAMGTNTTPTYAFTAQGAGTTLMLTPPSTLTQVAAPSLLSVQFGASVQILAEAPSTYTGGYTYQLGSGAAAVAFSAADFPASHNPRVQGGADGSVLSTILSSS